MRSSVIGECGWWERGSAVRFRVAGGWWKLCRGGKTSVDCGGAGGIQDVIR
jgi:hypothetical protein